MAPLKECSGKHRKQLTWRGKGIKYKGAKYYTGIPIDVKLAMLKIIDLVMMKNK